MSTFQLVLVTAVPTVVLVVTAVFLWIVARRRQSQVTSPPAPIATASDPLGTESLLSAISQRLAAVEGRVGSIAAQLDGVSVLQQRLATIESHMPSLQDAMEKYADQISRADKRTTERDRRNRADEAKWQTAGEAASSLIGVEGAGGNPTLTQPSTPQNEATKRAGVLGQGGRHR